MNIKHWYGMHYVICYDLENDRFRAKAAKTLERHGCSRIQKSVFVAASLDTKHLSRLTRDLNRLLEGRVLAPGEGIVLVPVPAESGKQILVLGNNNVLAELEAGPLKVLL